MTLLWKILELSQMRQHSLADDHFASIFVDIERDLIGWLDPQTRPQSEAEVSNFRVGQCPVKLLIGQGLPKVDDGVQEHASTLGISTTAGRGVIKDQFSLPVGKQEGPPLSLILFLFTFLVRSTWF